MHNYKPKRSPMNTNRLPTEPDTNNPLHAALTTTSARCRVAAALFGWPGPLLRYQEEKQEGGKYGKCHDVRLNLKYGQKWNVNKTRKTFPDMFVEMSKLEVWRTAAWIQNFLVHPTVLLLLGFPLKAPLSSPASAKLDL